MVCSKLVGGLATALIALIASGTIALACAGGFMQAILFHSYPGTRAVSIAIAKARMNGTLTGDERPKSSGWSPHAWHIARTKETMLALQDWLNATMRPPVPLAETKVFLINEFAWLDITTDGSRIAVSRRPFGSPMKGPRVFTSRHVLDNVLEGAITWQQAIDLGLIIARCKGDCAGNRFGLLGLAMARPKKPARVRFE